MDGRGKGEAEGRGERAARPKEKIKGEGVQGMEKTEEKGEVQGEESRRGGKGAEYELGKEVDRS